MLSCGSPAEQKELEEKRRLLEELETEYASKQLEYSTLAGEIAAFRNRYYLRVGSLYAQLDTLRAEIQEKIAGRNPENAEAIQSAERIRQQAEETIHEVNSATEDEPVAFEPSADLKQTYREAAKLIHPDRARDGADRELRDRLMVEVNAAYAAGDIDAIHDIIERSRSRLEAGEMDDIGTQLVRAIRSIARTRNRVRSLVQAINGLKASTWFRLKAEIERGEAGQEDPLGQMAERVHAEIVAEQQRLNDLLAALADTVPNPDDAAPQEEVHESEQQPESVPFRPEGLIHRTERGEKVRSKSEAIIANILHNQGLDYRYEYPIEGHLQSGVRRPDFVFITPARKAIIWEHLGMLDNPDYRSRWQAKQAWYEANGFTQGVDFFVTRDEVDGGLDSHRIRKTAEYIKTLLTP